MTVLTSRSEKQPTCRFERRGYGLRFSGVVLVTIAQPAIANGVVLVKKKTQLANLNLPPKRPDFWHAS